MKLEPIYRTIGVNIRLHRRKRDVPQQHLAREIGVSRATLANMESGRQRVFAHQLQALADALDCEIEALMPPPPRVDPHRTALVFDRALNAQQRSQLAQIIDAVPSQSIDINHSKPDASAKTRKGRARRARR